MEQIHRPRRIIDCRSGGEVELGQRVILTSSISEPPVDEEGNPNYRAPSSHWTKRPVEHWFVLHSLHDEGDPLPDGVKILDPEVLEKIRASGQYEELQFCVIEFYADMYGPIEHDKCEWVLPVHENHPHFPGETVLLVAKAL